MVAVEHLKTPTAQFADFILPGDAWTHADAQLCADDPDFLDREQGIPHLKGIPCTVRPAAA